MSNPRSNQNGILLGELNTQGSDEHQNRTWPRVGRWHQGLRHSFVRNIPRQWASVICWTFMLLFALFLSYYFYEILVATQPRLGKLFPAAGNTNLVVAVLSQIFGALILGVYLDLFNTLRFQLLARHQGAQLLEVEQLSRSTSWIDTLSMCLIPGSHRKWTVQR